MKIIKFFLILLVVLGIIGGALYFVQQHSPSGQLPTQLASLQVLEPYIQTGIATASQHLPQVTQVGSVLGIKTEVANGGPSLPQQAFEYARYTYCQQVVTDYQQRYASASASIVPSPKPQLPSVNLPKTK